jgi:hypothetical protein
MITEVQNVVESIDGLRVGEITFMNKEFAIQVLPTIEVTEDIQKSLYKKMRAAIPAEFTFMIIYCFDLPKMIVTRCGRIADPAQ